MKKILWMLPLLLTVCGMMSAAPASAQETRVKIRLAGPAIAGLVPEGSSEIRVDARRQSFRVEVNRVNLANGTTLTARVNGVSVGTLLLSSGVGRLELQSERGQVIPAIKKGDVVTVTNSAGATIVSGQF